VAVVTSAGIHPQFRIEDLTEECFDKVIAVNLKGTFLVCQNAVRTIRAAHVKSGSIVTIASITATHGIAPKTHYSASKAGVVGFTKALAQEVVSDGIRCNSVLPGVTDTPLVQSLAKNGIDDFVASVPMKRMAEPLEIANVVKFLVSDASSYMTGSTIHVTGGWGM